jgi:hypothetical protein
MNAVNIKFDTSLSNLFEMHPPYGAYELYLDNCCFICATYGNGTDEAIECRISGLNLYKTQDRTTTDFTLSSNLTNHFMNTHCIFLGKVDLSTFVRNTTIDFYKINTNVSVNCAGFIKFRLVEINNL